MELIRNLGPGYYGSGTEGECYFGLFDRYIKLIDDESNLEYASQCVMLLNSLEDSVIDALCEASIRYCNGFLEDIGEPTRRFDTPRAVLDLINPVLLLVPYLTDSRVPVVHLELNCDWEVEHGMEWIVREDRVQYVGAFHGEDPWRDFSVMDAWNYA
ncbi:MAG: hypothetical protein QNJ00_12465 [Woeseiaceae bacterium]|nr:hypothetical protein [Woeseiaceae bacterium]